jgi:hypothetical protein
MKELDKTNYGVGLLRESAEDHPRDQALNLKTLLKP